jgi:hypothetical protein
MNQLAQQTNLTKDSSTPSQAKIDYSQYKILKDKIVDGEEITFDDCVAAVDVITEMQAGVEKIARRAGHDIAKKVRQLNFFQQIWTAPLDALKSRLKPDKSSLPLGNAGTLKWESSGGWVVDDREKIKDYLAQKPAEDLEEYGAAWTLSFNVDKIIKIVETTGEVIPGVVYIEPNPHAKLRIGVNRPWSSRKIKMELGKALEGTMQDDPEEEE